MPITPSVIITRLPVITIAVCRWWYFRKYSTSEAESCFSADKGFCTIGAVSCVVIFEPLSILVSIPFVLICVNRKQSVWIYIWKESSPYGRNLRPCKRYSARKFIVQRFVTHPNTFRDCFFLNSTPGDFSFKCGVINHIVSPFFPYSVITIWLYTLKRKSSTLFLEKSSRFRQYHSCAIPVFVLYYM